MEGKSGACRKRAVERQSKQIENQPFCELQDGLNFLRNRCQLVSRVLAPRKKWHFSVLVFASHSFIIYTLFENEYVTKDQERYLEERLVEIIVEPDEYGLEEAKADKKTIVKGLRELVNKNYDSKLTDE